MKIIDLSKEIYKNMPVYNTDPKVDIKIVNTYEEHTWEVRKLCLGTHTGTHVDSYSHMHKGMDTIDNISLDKFIGNAMVVNKDDVFIEGVGIFFIEEVDINILDKILKYKPKFVGGNITAELERKLLYNEIITYTDLINLELIPKNKIFKFIGLPLKIKSGDGSPVRAIAIVDW